MDRREWLKTSAAAVATASLLQSCDQTSGEELPALADLPENALTARYVPFTSLIDCISCENCMPCPYGIHIPDNLIFTDHAIYDKRIPGEVTDPDFAPLALNFLERMENKIPAKASAWNCIGCGQCLPLCPEHIDIPARLAQMAALTDVAREIRCSSVL